VFRKTDQIQRFTQKVNVSLSLNYDMNRGVEVKLHTFLTLAVHGDGLLHSHFAHFTPGERIFGSQWMDGNKDA
jgi:hypothetical protein